MEAQEAIPIVPVAGPDDGALVWRKGSNEAACGQRTRLLSTLIMNDTQNDALYFRWILETIDWLPRVMMGANTGGSTFS